MRAQAKLKGPAGQAEIDAAITWHERGASEKARQRGALLLRAVKMIEAARPGELMTAYAAAARECGRSGSSIRDAVAWAMRFPEYAREAALTAKWGGAEKSWFVDTVPGLADFCRGLVIERRNLIRTAAAARVAREKFGLDVKHQRAIEDWIREFRNQNAAELLIATNPDAAKSRLLTAHGSKSAGLAPFDLVELDGSPADALVVDTPSGRCRVLVMVDVASRRTVAIVGDSESSDETGRLFVKFVRKLGLMRAERTDRGAGFISAGMRAFLDRMGVALEIVPPYSGQAKPFVESAVRRIQGFLALEAGFGGHQVAERTQLRGALSMAARRGKSEKQILGVRYTRDELEQRIDEFLDVEADRQRDELDGRSPNQVIAEWQARGGVMRRVSDEQALWTLLAPAGTAAVGKKGIQVEGRVYVASDFGKLQGHRVEYRRHPDPNRLVIYSAERTPRFLCIARRADMMDDAERQAEAIEARAEFRVRSKQIRAAARTLVKQVGGTPADIILSARKPSGETKVVAVPFTTPALVEAGKAARAMASEADDLAAPAELSEEMRQKLADDPDLVEKIRAASPALRAGLRIA